MHRCASTHRQRGPYRGRLAARLLRCWGRADLGLRRCGCFRCRCGTALCSHNWCFRLMGWGRPLFARGFMFARWLRLGNRDSGTAGRFLRRRRFCGALYALAHALGDVFIKGTGVSFFLGDTQLRQHLEDGMRGDFELPGQLVDANFAHKRQQRPAIVALNQPPPSSLWYQIHVYRLKIRPEMRRPPPRSRAVAPHSA